MIRQLTVCSLLVCVVSGNPAFKLGRDDVVAVVDAFSKTADRPYTAEFEPDFFIDFGYEYDQFAICPDNMWANGYRQKTDKGCAGGGECSGLNGVELVCSPDGGSGNQAAVRVEVDVPLGLDVNWRLDHMCKAGFIFEAQLLSQPSQGFFGDDSGANGVNVGCSDGNRLLHEEDVRHTGGDQWSDFRTCPAGSVVCGVASAGYWEVTDNVALTKLKFFCCDGAPKPSNPTTPSKL